MASFSLQQAMGLRDLRLTATMKLGGATAGAMIMHAAEAIDAGMANTVACVFADAPLKPPRRRREGRRRRRGSAAAYGFARGLDAAYGQFGVNATTPSWRAATCICTARRTTISARSRSERASGPTAIPPRSSTTVPMTLEDYHPSRWVVEPFHLYDCCLVSNGGLAR